jgi:hypothetical protein
MCVELCFEGLTVPVIAYAVDDWLRVVRKDLFHVCKFIEGVGFTYLLFCYQDFVLMEYLHV